MSTSETVSSDLDTWKDGVEKYRAFFDSLSTSEKVTLHSGQGPGDIQALFLGEKPVFLFDFKDRSFFEKITSMGFEAAGDFIYTRSGVQEVLNKYGKVFARTNCNSVDDCIELMKKIPAKIPDEYLLEVGLLLGYPYSAATLVAKNNVEHKTTIDRIYEIWNRPLSQAERSERLIRIKKYESNSSIRKSALCIIMREDLMHDPASIGISDEEAMELLPVVEEMYNTEIFNAYGFHWKDKSDSEESHSKLAYLRDALEQSGILEIKPSTVTMMYGKARKKLKTFFQSIQTH